MTEWKEREKKCVLKIHKIKKIKVYLSNSIIQNHIFFICGNCKYQQANYIQYSRE